MSKITNQQVYDALTHCIEKRWRLIVNKRRRSALVPPCSLCKLFDGGTQLGGGSCDECRGCPVYLMNSCCGCSHGSLFYRWADNPSQENAEAMLDSLKKAKEHFFGDWKK